MVSLANEFTPVWPLRDIRKGDLLRVPRSTPAHRKIWGFQRFPLWEDYTSTEPWWQLTYGTHLLVTGSPCSYQGHQWIPVQFEQGPVAWIKIKHAGTCDRKRGARKKRLSHRGDNTPLPLNKLRAGIVVEYKNAWALVISWNENCLPEPSYGALVAIETAQGTREAWLQELSL